MSGGRTAVARTFVPGAGFTLLELIAVLLVVAIAAAVALPSLGRFYAGREIDHAAARVLVLARRGRLRAVSEAQPHRFQLDVEAGEYWLEVLEGSEYRAITESLGVRRRLPDGVLSEWDEPADGIVWFDPTGRATVSRLRLTGRDGTEVWLICDAPTEPLRLASTGVPIQAPEATP